MEMQDIFGTRHNYLSVGWGLGCHSTKADYSKPTDLQTNTTSVVASKGTYPGKVLVCVVRALADYAKDVEVPAGNVMCCLRPELGCKS